MGRKRQPELQVLIPYRDLVELLQASRELQELRKEMRQLREQQAALRYQFVELMEVLRDRN